jgi:two-component system response regulator DevR
LAEPDGSVSVLIVDDHEVVRMGLRGILEHTPGMRVVGEAGSVAGAVEQAEALHPDVVVLDVRLPDGSGVQACRDIRARCPATGVLMLTSYGDDEALFQSILAGAAGYLLKQTRARDLVNAIRSVAAGEQLLDPGVTRAVFDRLRRPTGDPLSELTTQERRTLELIAEGKTNREIAEVLFVSDKTVKHYVSAILAKLDVARRSEAAAIWGRRHQG